MHQAFVEAKRVKVGGLVDTATVAKDLALHVGMLTTSSLCTVLWLTHSFTIQVLLKGQDLTGYSAGAPTSKGSVLLFFFFFIFFLLFQRRLRCALCMTT